MDIKETFLKLTSKTYPHGTESELFDLLPDYLDVDQFGNRFYQIGENPTCMFTSHLDTATSVKTDVIHVEEGNIIKTDGKSILGADDKAGVTVMLYMIENKVPGIYYFFLGEEVGCVGSRKVSDYYKDNKIESIKKVISFDRRGYDSVITFQSSSRCCSEKFAEALAKELNNSEIAFKYSPDPTGIYTDSAQFTRIYPECTNISVGYKSEHTFSEQQDIAHLELLAKACIKVDWESLPVERDPSKYEHRTYNYGYGYGWGEWEDEWDEYYGVNRKSYSTPVVSNDETCYFWDEMYNYVSGVKRKKYSNKLVGIDFADERIEYERGLISNLLESLEVKYSEIVWDGFTLTVKHNVSSGDHSTKCDRDEIAEFLPQLDFWKNLIEEDFKGSDSRTGYSYGENIF